jgi:flagellar hook-length control protein FliK
VGAAEPFASPPPVARGPEPIHAPVAPQPAPPTGPTTRLPDVARHVHTLVVRTLESGEREARIRVHPPELGTIHIRLAEQRGALHLNFDVQSAAVREALLAAEPELSAALRAQGMEISEFAVNVGGHPNHDPSGDAPRGDRALGAPADRGPDDPRGADPVERVHPIGAGRLDVIA